MEFWEPAILATSSNADDRPAVSGVQHHGGQGVLYLAFGAAYLAMALLSFRSLRATNRDLAVCIVTNVCEAVPVSLPGWNPQRDNWRYIDAVSSVNRFYKTALNTITPFDRTVFLDCDTLVTGSLSPLFDFLQYFDIGLRLKDQPLQKTGFGALKVMDDAFCLSELPHWNSGVIAFRANAKVDDFFKIWSRSHQSLGSHRDQQSLVEALLRSDCKLLSFDGRWNMTGKTRADWSRADVVVLHYMAALDEYIFKLILETARSTGIERDAAVQNFINKRRRLVRLKTNKFQYMSFVANELLRPRSGSLRKRLRLLPLD